MSSSNRALYLWLAFGLGFFLFSNGRWAMALCAWAAPIFLLRFLRLGKATGSLSLLLVLFVIAARAMLFGIIPELPGVLTYVLTMYYALLWFVPYAVDRLIASRRSGFASTLLFPAAAVSVEYLNTVFFGSWSATAYTQFELPAILQLASLTGMWGITFLVLWFGSTVNWFWSHEFDWKQIRHGAWVYFAVIGLTVTYSAWRVGAQDPGHEGVVVAGITAKEAIVSYRTELVTRGFTSSAQMASSDRAAMRELTTDLYAQAFLKTRNAAQAGARLILWPEEMVPVLAEDESAFLSMGSDLADSEEVYLLLSYHVFPKERPWSNGENKCVFINPQGEQEWQYLKSRPVPGSSDVPGDGRLPVSETPFGRLSAAICYDMDFTGLIHQAGRADVDIMLVPAWDWQAIDPLHAQMAVYRGVENGFAVVRQTGEGLSIATDHRGRTLAAVDYFTAEDPDMLAEVPTRGTSTPYSRIGDLFAWLCLAGFFLGSAKVLLHRQRKSDRLD